MNLTSTASVARSLAGIIAVSGGIEAIDVFYETLGTISPEDIKDVAGKYFTDNRKTEILVIGE